MVYVLFPQPGNLQANAQPVVQNLTESLDHIKKELFKKG